MENVPKESDTIASKKAVRLAEKIGRTHVMIDMSKAWWADGPVEILGLLGVLAINFILIYPMIGKPSESLNFSGPVLPILAKAVSLTGAPFVYSIELVNIIFFLAFPLTFYFFVKMVSGRRFSAFLAVLIATLPFYLFAKTRFQTGVIGSESPYIASLTVLPLALSALLNFLRVGGIKNLFIASLSVAFLSLISPFGTFIYIITSVITTFSEVLLGEGRLKILRLITVYIFGTSLSSFWYNPSFVYWIIAGPMGEGVRFMIQKLIPLFLFIVPILASLGYLLFDRKPALQPLFLALFYTLAFLILVFTGKGFAPSSPERYTAIFGISLSFLLGIVVLNLVEYSKSHFPKIFFAAGAKEAVLIIISVSIAALIIVWRSAILPGQSNVLGLWTNIEKGDVWIARDQFGGNATSLPGYLITAIGGGTLVYLSRKSRVS